MDTELENVGRQGVAQVPCLDTPFVLARDGPDSGAIVLVPGIGGDPAVLNLLWERIAGDCAILVADLRVLLARTGEDLRVESLARLALEALGQSGRHDVQAFVGFSFGGLVALEMARLARAEPGQAPALVLIDAAPEQSHWPRAVWLRSARRRTIRRLMSLRGRSLRSAIAEIARSAARLLVRLRRRGGRSRLLAAPGSPAAAASPISSPQARLAQAFDRYEPTFYAGRVVLFESTANILLSGNLPDIWRPLTAELEHHQLPGDHLDLLRSPVPLDQLAKSLNARLGLGPAAVDVSAPSKFL